VPPARSAGRYVRWRHQCCPRWVSLSILCLTRQTDGRTDRHRTDALYASARRGRRNSRVRCRLSNTALYQRIVLHDDLFNLLSTSAEVLFELITSKCLPILLYGTDACPTNSADRRSLQFTINQIVYEIFGAMSEDLYIEIIAHFGVESVENLVADRRNRFVNRYGETDNYLCPVLRWLVRFSGCIFIYCVCLMSVCWIYSFILCQATTIRWWNKVVCCLMMPTRAMRELYSSHRSVECQQYRTGDSPGPVSRRRGVLIRELLIRPRATDSLKPAACGSPASSTSYRNGGAENASTGKRKYGKCKYNANLQSHKKKFGTLQVSVVHFQVGGKVNYRLFFFWDNVNNQK